MRLERFGDIYVRSQRSSRLAAAIRASPVGTQKGNLVQRSHDPMVSSLLTSVAQARERTVSHRLASQEAADIDTVGRCMFPGDTDRNASCS